MTLSEVYLLKAGKEINKLMKNKKTLFIVFGLIRHNVAISSYIKLIETERKRSSSLDRGLLNLKQRKDVSQETIERFQTDLWASISLSAQYYEDSLNRLYSFRDCLKKLGYKFVLRSKRMIKDRNSFVHPNFQNIKLVLGENFLLLPKPIAYQKTDSASVMVEKYYAALKKAEEETDEILRDVLTK